MTNISQQTSSQTDRFNGTIASLFMAVTVALAGFMSVAMFAG